jgi:hypothetical protein
MRIYTIKRIRAIRSKIRKENRFSKNDIREKIKIWKTNKRSKDKNRQKYRTDVCRQSSDSMWRRQCILNLQKKKDSEHGKRKSGYKARAISSLDVSWSSKLIS